MTDKGTKRPMPKGGKKGGSVFPRVSLSDALGYSKKLVSKTHVSAQPVDVILTGVVGARRGRGAVRMSALKQYGLMVGNKKDGFRASPLAKAIDVAIDPDKIALLGKAALKPKIFSAIFATFRADKVTKAKLRARASDLKVHPDELGSCVELYVSSLDTAGLVKVDGDQVEHMEMHQTAAPSPAAEDVTSATNEVAEPEADVVDAAQPLHEVPEPAVPRNADNVAAGSERRTSAHGSVTVTINVDSSLDTEKLARQLQLLRRYGAI